jgi:ribonuclease III
MTSAFSRHLRYSFREPALLRQALTHRSSGPVHNERLEFVGDAVLNCVVGLALYERFPALPEGDLSRLRAALVKQETLARVAQRLEIGPAIALGEGELKSGGPQRPSIQADALEAVFGAVFLDAGFDAARSVIVDAYAELLANADPLVLGKDAKTRLQEWLQARRMPLPEYVVTATSGEAHLQQFSVECRIAALGITSAGAGTSRRVAEQAAAEGAVRALETEAPHGA